MDDAELNPIYTWREARDLGARRRQVAADGIRVSQGLYLSRSVAPSLLARCRAWTRLLPPDSAFGLQTATELLGVPVATSPDVHVVLRPRRVLPQRRGLVVHARQIQESDVVEVAGLRLTAGPQLFLDLAAELAPAELVVAGDALSRIGMLAAEELAGRLARAGGVRGVVLARRCAPLLSAQAMSRPESLLRYWLHRSDLPEPEEQVPVLDGTGREVAHADLGYSRWKVALEYDGRQHAEPEQFGRDVDRYSLMAADGWLVLRFASRHLSGPVVVVDRTRRALAGRGWRPGRC
jgi:Protein of unknown function (DUF559)